jgi:hypothetical protein
LHPSVSIIGIIKLITTRVCHSGGQKWNAYTIFDGAHENIRNLEDPGLGRRIIL